jgi:hypothetical protein
MPDHAGRNIQADQFGNFAAFKECLHDVSDTRPDLDGPPRGRNLQPWEQTKHDIQIGGSPRSKVLDRNVVMDTTLYLLKCLTLRFPGLKRPDHWLSSPLY